MVHKLIGFNDQQRQAQLIWWFYQDVSKNLQDIESMDIDAPILNIVHENDPVATANTATRIPGLTKDLGSTWILDYPTEDSYTSHHSISNMKDYLYSLAEPCIYHNLDSVQEGDCLAVSEIESTKIIDQDLRTTCEMLIKMYLVDLPRVDENLKLIIASGSLPSDEKNNLKEHSQDMKRFHLNRIEEVCFE